MYAAGALVLVLLAVGGWFACAGPGDGAIDMGWLDASAEGNVVYCSGADVSTSQHRSVDDYNASSDSGQSKAKLIDDFDSAATADGQRQEYLKRMDDGDCDVVYLDVVYMPEFASKDLLRDMTPYVTSRGAADTFDDRMLRTAAYDGDTWGVPKHLDGGLMFYLEDTDKAPESWQDVLERAKPRPGDKPGLRLQLDAYEGLTVVFLELAYAAGAEDIVSEDGKTANLVQPGTLAALSFMRRAIATRAVPGTVTSLGDRGSFDVFSRGRAKYLRSWPYVEARLLPAAEDSKKRGSTTAPARFSTARGHGVMALPPWQRGGDRIGVLGGHHLVIPRSAKNPQGALHLIDYLTGREQTLEDARTASLAPVLTQLRSHEDVSANPALSAVQDMDLRLRPVIKNYARVSRAIYEALRRVLRTGQSEERLMQTLRDIQRDVQAAL